MPARPRAASTAAAPSGQRTSASTASAAATRRAAATRVPPEGGVVEGHDQSLAFGVHQHGAIGVRAPATRRTRRPSTPASARSRRAAPAASSPTRARGAPRRRPAAPPPPRRWSPCRARPPSCPWAGSFPARWASARPGKWCRASPPRSRRRSPSSTTVQEARIEGNRASSPPTSVSVSAPSASVMSAISLQPSGTGIAPSA